MFTMFCFPFTAFQNLQGDVEYYTLLWNSGALNKSLKIFLDVDSHAIGILAPNTECQIFLSVFSEVRESTAQWWDTGPRAMGVSKNASGSRLSDASGID